MSRPTRIPQTEATGPEWTWLTAAPGHNPFLGFFDGGTVTTWDRLQGLWDLHEGEIRQGWGEKTPPPLPFGHPAVNGGQVGCPVIRSRREWGGAA